MTTLPERLLAQHAALGDMSTGLTGHTVVLNARRAAEIHALLAEAAAALQAAAPSPAAAQQAGDA